MPEFIDVSVQKFKKSCFNDHYASLPDVLTIYESFKTGEVALGAFCVNAGEDCLKLQQFKMLVAN